MFLNHVWFGVLQICPHKTLKYRNKSFKILLGPILMMLQNLKQGSTIRAINGSSLQGFLQTVQILSDVYDSHSLNDIFYLLILGGSMGVIIIEGPKPEP